MFGNPSLWEKPIRTKKAYSAALERIYELMQKDLKAGSLVGSKEKVRHGDENIGMKKAACGN